MTQNEQKLQDLLSHAPMGISLCRAAYSVIDEAPEEEKAGLLEYLAARYGNTATDKSMKLPAFISSLEKGRLLKKYGIHIDAHMSALQQLELPKADFYGKLWAFISASSGLPTWKARVFALYHCVIDCRLPYYPIDRTAALTISQEAFHGYEASIGEETLGRLQYILSADFSSRTQQASLLATMLDAQESFEKRVVLLTNILAYYESGPFKQREEALFRILGCGPSLADLFEAEDTEKE